MLIGGLRGWLHADVNMRRCSINFKFPTKINYAVYLGSNPDLGSRGLYRTIIVPTSYCSNVSFNFSILAAGLHLPSFHPLAASQGDTVDFRPRDFHRIAALPKHGALHLTLLISFILLTPIYEAGLDNGNHIILSPLKEISPRANERRGGPRGLPSNRT